MSTHEEEIKLLENQIAILKKQQEITETKKAIAEAQKATREASFPEGETKPLEGEITTDEGFGYIAELVAYQAMKASAEAVGKRINNLSLSPENAKILIVSELNFAQGDLPLIQLEKQFEFFLDRLEAQTLKNNDLCREMEPLPHAIPPISELEAVVTSTPLLLPTVAAVVSSLADIMGYFQINYNIKGQDFELGSDALIAIIASKINKHDIHVLNFNMVNDSDILNSFTNLLGKKQSLELSKVMLKSTLIEPINTEINRITGELQKLETDLMQLKQNQDQKRIENVESQIRDSKKILKSKNELLSRAKTAILESEEIITAFNNFVNAITSITDEKAQPLLLQAATRKHIRELGITHLLYLNILSSGGEAVTKKRRFSSGETSYIGGSAISYILVISDGHVVSADTLVEVAQLDYQLSSKGGSEFRNIRFTLKQGEGT